MAESRYISGPVPELLTREGFDSKAHETICFRCADLLKRLVDFATHAIQWAGQEATTGLARDYHLLLLQRAIRTVDSVSLCVEAGQPLVGETAARSLFELKLFQLWLTERNRETRANCYRYFYHAIQLKHAKGWRRIHEAQDARSLAIRWSPGWNDVVPNCDRIDEAITKLTSILESPELAKIHQIATGIRPLKLYSQLDGGPANRANLAVELGHGAQYELLYRSQSASSHGENLPVDLVFAEGSGVLGIRLPEQLPHATTVVANELLAICMKFIETELPTKTAEYGLWYLSDFRREYTLLAKTNVTVNYTKRGSDTE